MSASSAYAFPIATKKVNGEKRLSEFAIFPSQTRFNRDSPLYTLPVLIPLDILDRQDQPC